VLRAAALTPPHAAPRSKDTPTHCQLDAREKIGQQNEIAFTAFGFNSRRWLLMYSPFLHGIYCQRFSAGRRRQIFSRQAVASDYAAAFRHAERAAAAFFRDVCASHCSFSEQRELSRFLSTAVFTIQAIAATDIAAEELTVAFTQRPGQAT